MEEATATLLLETVLETFTCMPPASSQQLDEPKGSQSASSPSASPNIPQVFRKCVHQKQVETRKTATHFVFFCFFLILEDPQECVTHPPKKKHFLLTFLHKTCATISFMKKKLIVRESEFVSGTTFVQTL